MEEYLPPVVTKLKADLSDLVAGFAQARTLMREWASGVREDLDSELRNIGRNVGLSFAADLRSTLKQVEVEMPAEMGGNFASEAVDSFGDAGKKAGESFVGQLSAIAWPLLIASLVLLSPLIVTAISSAIVLGMGGLFIGLGAFLLREQKGLITAATSFKTALKEVFTEAATPLLGPMITALNILTAGVREVGPQFKEVFAGIAGALPNVATGLVGFFREMMPGLKELAPVMGSLLSSFGAILPDIGRGLSNMFSSLAEAAPGILRFMGDFGGMMEGLLTTTGKVLNTFSEIYLFLAELHDSAVADDWDEVNIPYFGPLIVAGKKAWEVAKEAWGGISGLFTQTKTDVTNWAKDTWADISDWAGKVGGWFSELPGKVGDWISSLPGKVAAIIAQTFDLFFYAVGFGLGRIFVAITEWPPKVIQIFHEWTNKLTGLIGGVVLSILGAWQSFRTELPLLLAQAWQAVSTWAVDVYNTAKNWVINTVSEIVTWFGELPGKVRKKGDDLKETIINFFKEASKWLYTAGKDLIDGLVKGVTDKIDGAVGAIKRAMDRIKQGAKDALGISSPSKVFAELGAFSMQGFVQGFASEKGALSRIWASLAPGSFGSPQLAVAAAGGEMRSAGGAASGGPTMVHATFQIDGATVVDAIAPAAQDKKKRNGESGLS